MSAFKQQHPPNYRINYNTNTNNDKQYSKKWMKMMTILTLIVS